MKKAIILFCSLLASVALGFAQASQPSQTVAPAARGAVSTPASASSSSSSTSTRQDLSAVAQERLLIATSSVDYPVTPSDLYTLTYRQSTGVIQTQAIQVASDYSVDLGLFGKIDARSLKYIDLKTRVENLVAESYARSYPSLTIDAVGIYRVGLNGAIASSRFVNAWGFSRLSDIVEEAAESSTSIRSIDLKSRDGLVRHYDLLSGMRKGDASQNPILKPGDSIYFSPSLAKINLNGEVNFPGKYELLPGEGLAELVEKFGGGLTDFAEPSRIRIDRISSKGPTAQYMELKKAYSPPISLEGCLSVNVPSRMENRPVVWFEGAITSASIASSPAQQSGMTSIPSLGGMTTSQAGVQRDDYNRVHIQIFEGEMLSDALREIQSTISTSADLSSAVLYRQGSASRQAIDLQPLLAMVNPPTDLRLEPYDRIFIPGLRSTISVNGAVFGGGSFAYQPNSPASYYIGLAGGADPERNTKGDYWVYDKDGKRRKAEDSLMPGDRIYVPASNITYNVVRYTPVVSGIVTLVILIVNYFK
jgi:polysaccharide biosynthesis/export protein